MMLELKRRLAKELEKRRVRIEVPDNNTVLFRGVPTNESFFNKKRTNLLIKKADTAMPFLVFVDEDLVYQGADAALVKAFTAGPKQEGWRVLFMGNVPEGGFQGIVEQGLSAVGFQEREPELSLSAPSSPAATDGSLLTSFGINLSDLVAEEHIEPTLGRTSETEAAVSCLLRWGQARLPLIIGESGVGKSNLLYATARLMKKARPGVVLSRVDLADIFAGTLFDAERERLLSALLKEATADPNTAVAVEHLECAVLEVTHGTLLLTEALDKGIKLVGTVLPGYLTRFQGAPLARRIQPVVLSEPTPRETVAILEALREQLASHHHLEISQSVIALCVKTARSLAGRFPSKAIMLVDEAASNATLLGSDLVSPDDVCAAFSRCSRGAGVINGKDEE